MAASTDSHLVPASTSTACEDTKSAVETTGLTQDQYDVAKLKNSNWPHDSDRDGWCRIHAGLMKVLKLYTKAVEACCNRGTVEGWMVDDLMLCYKIYNNELHHHHDTEEQIAFPFMEGKCTIPQGMKADHKEIMSRTAKIEADTLALKTATDAKSLLQSLAQQCRELVTINEDHFTEEEKVALILLRHHFTSKEWIPVEGQILKNATLDAMAILLDSMESDAERISWMTEVALIPWFVRKFVLMPAHKKHVNTLVKKLSDVIKGEKTPSSSMFCGCS
mmetsp:Transcript_37377/g.70173  ORF Transcript_37377/g.70173 Transcript_37377/m.70173 type:complete len:277 (-) Transcript_37377:368-1198(-)